MRTCALAILGLALLAPPAPAQDYDPYASYNRRRAYRQFLTSPARVKSYSAMRAGRVWEYHTPYESVRTVRTPAYYREYVSPYWHSEIDVPSTVIETTYRRPVIYNPPVIVAPRFYPGLYAR